MKQKLFHKYLEGISVLLLLLIGGLKIHSLFFVKDVSDWDFQSLQNIDTTRKDFSFAVFGDNKNSITTFNNLINRINSDDVMFTIHLLWEIPILLFLMIPMKNQLISGNWTGLKTN